MNLTQQAITAANKDTIDRLHELLSGTDRANPDPAQRQALKAFLSDNPGMWAYVGNLAEQAALQLVGRYEATDAFTLSVKQGLHELTRDLRRPTDGPLEALLIQQVVLCWLRWADVEYRLSAARGADIDYYEKRLNGAQRRYLRAVEALARVRKLNLPPVQVNIGQQQVNQLNTKR